MIIEDFMWIEKEISIGEVKDLLNDGYYIEVDSPDGYVPISLFVDKGEWEEYTLTLYDGRTVRVNENHLFETTSGWKYAKDLCGIIEQFVCDNGINSGVVTKTGNKIPIVDIQVEHDNHRYYTNGISSHNTGVGKSLFMCHGATANLQNGKNVLYITMEMAEERIAERIDSNLLNMTIDDLYSVDKQTYINKFKKLKSKSLGKLVIKQYPTSSAHAGHFRSLIQELKTKKSFTPDIIYIDYLNICSSQRVKMGAGANSYTIVKSIAEELRALAVEFDVPIVTATQTNREGMTASDPELTNTSESFGVPATADFMFALISTEELEQLNQIMVKQLKNRYSDPGFFKKFVIGIDRSKMRLYDVENSAQKNIVDSGQKQNVTKPNVGTLRDRPVFDATPAGNFDFQYD